MQLFTKDIKSIGFIKVITGWKRKFLLIIPILQPHELFLKEKVGLQIREGLESSVQPLVMN